MVKQTPGVGGVLRRPVLVGADEVLRAKNEITKLRMYCVYSCSNNILKSGIHHFKFLSIAVPLPLGLYRAVVCLNQQPVHLLPQPKPS